MASEEKKNTAEKMKKLAEFKATLEKKVAETESALENLKILLEFVDKTLLERGFKRAEIAKPKSAETPVLPPVVKYETVVPLKTATGELLANLYLNQDSMHVTMAEDKDFNLKTPPFQQFLVERVLNKMQERDSEAVSIGKMASNEVFSYELILDGNTIREILIGNLTADRLRELKSSIHWTLEKMYEKTKEES